MWANTLRQYCSGPVDGNLYAIVRKTADGSYVEESSGGEDSGCGASSNVGYKPAADAPVAPPSASAPPPPPQTGTAHRAQHDDGGALQDIDRLLEDLLGAGAVAGLDHMPMSPPPPLPPPPQAPPPPPRSSIQPETPVATERERQLAAELRRTQRQLHQKLRRLRRRTASESASADDDDSEDEAAAAAVAAADWTRRSQNQNHEQEQHYRQQHQRERSFRSEKSSHHQRSQQEQSYETYQNYQYHNDQTQQPQQQLQLPHQQHRQQHQHNHQKHRQHHHQQHHQQHQEHHQHQQQQSYHHPQHWESRNRQSAGSYYSTAEGDLQFQTGKAGHIDPQLFSQPPLWEKRYHTALPASNRQHQRYSERFDEFHSSHQGSNLNQRQSQVDPPAAATTSPGDHRDLLEVKLQELQEQMRQTKERLLLTAGRHGSPGDSSQAATPRRSARSLDRTQLQRHQQTTSAQLITVPQAESYQEVETVSMQLIGKGIHDLDSKTNPRLKQVGNQSLTPQPRLPKDTEMGTTSGGSSATPTATNQNQPFGQQKQQQPQQPIRIENHWQRKQHPPVNGSAGIASEPHHEPLPPPPQQQQQLVPSSPGTLSSGLSSSPFLSPTASATSGDAAKDTMHLWHRPSISRDEAINQLRQTVPGSFLVRDSNSFLGAYGLAIHVGGPQSVRHFLIEPAASGVRLRGCLNEPTFGSLAALIWQHSLTQLALPCRLLLPQVPRDPAAAAAASGSAGDYDQPDKIAAAAAAASSSETTASMSSLQSGFVATFPVVFIGSVNVESLTGTEAVTRAVDALLGNGREPARQQPVTAECQLRVASPEGVTLTDQQRRLFFRRHYPLSAVLHCGLDGMNRSAQLSTGSHQQQQQQQKQQARLFGLVARVANSQDGDRGSGGGGGNSCTILCERDQQQPAPVIVSLVNQLLLGNSDRR